MESTNNKNYIIALVGVVALALVLYLVWTMRTSPEVSQTPEVSPGSENNQGSMSGQNFQSPSGENIATQLKGNGRVAFGLKAEPSPFDPNTIIILTFKSVDVLSPTKGWVPVITGPVSYNLTEIFKDGGTAFIKDVDLAPGTYNEMRVVVESIGVKKGSGILMDAKLPQKEVRIPAKLVVAKNEFSSAVLTLDVTKSLFTATNGTYVILPVFKVTTQSVVTSYQVREGMLTIIGGASVYDASWGMDVNGTVSMGYSLSSGSKVEVVGDTIRVVK